MSRANERERIARSAKELARSDVGSETWAKTVKTRVLSASNSDTGLFVVASALLQVARDNRLAELSKQYQDASSAFKAKDYKRAQQIFESLGNYSDAKHKAEIAASNERDRIAKENEQRKRNEADYEKASNLEKQKKYDQAIAVFSKLGSFKDSQKRANDLRGKEKQYKTAKTKLDQGKYADAEREFARLDGFRDSRKLSKEANSIRTRDIRRKRATELTQELVKLKAEERKLTEQMAQYEEAQRIMNLPAKSPSLLVSISYLPSAFLLPYLALFGYWVTHDVQLGVAHVMILVVCIIFGPVVLIPAMAQESSQSKKKKEAERLLKNKDLNIERKILMTRSRIEHCSKELSTLGDDVLS